MFVWINPLSISSPTTKNKIAGSRKSCSVCQVFSELSLKIGLIQLIRQEKNVEI